MTPEQEKYLGELDAKRKEKLFLAGDLYELANWLNDGYLQRTANQHAQQLLMAEYEKLKRDAEAILDIINIKKKQYESSDE